MEAKNGGSQPITGFFLNQRWPITKFISARSMVEFMRSMPAAEPWFGITPLANICATHPQSCPVASLVRGWLALHLSLTKLFTTVRTTAFFTRWTQSRDLNNGYSKVKNGFGAALYGSQVFWLLLRLMDRFMASKLLLAKGFG